MFPRLRSGSVGSMVTRRRSQVECSVSRSSPGAGRSTTSRLLRPVVRTRAGSSRPTGAGSGRAAETLGLSGTVDSAALRALLTGVDPATGEVLSLRHAQVRVVAYDCTYSTPKSVSLLHALGPEEIRAEVRAGHEEAAAAALGYLERHGARVRRRSSRSDSASSIPAGGLVAAAFLHRTSRAPDPHLHSHVLVANLAPGPDSRWSALDGRGLYLEFATARDLYETQLRGELTGRLGVSWRELQGAWADLAGIDPNLSRAFSRRSIEIEAALEQSGRSGRRARQIASVKTRPEKDLATSYEELVSGWRERSYKLGVSDGRLASVAGRGVPTGGPSGSANAGEGSRPGSGRPSKSLSGLPELWASKVLGEHGAVARDGVCRRGELVRSRCASLPFGAPVAEVERDVDALVADGLVVPAPQSSGAFDRFLKATSGRSIPGGAFESVYTTPEILELHARLESLVRADPGAVELLAYPPGGRLGALDQLGELSSRLDTPITAVAPVVWRPHLSRPSPASRPWRSQICDRPASRYRSVARRKALSSSPKRNVSGPGSSPWSSKTRCAEEAGSSCSLHRPHLRRGSAPRPCSHLISVPSGPQASRMQPRLAATATAPRAWRRRKGSSLPVVRFSWRLTARRHAGFSSMRGTPLRAPVIACWWQPVMTPLCNRCETQLKRPGGRPTRSWSCPSCRRASRRAHDWRQEPDHRSRHLAERAQGDGHR